MIESFLRSNVKAEEEIQGSIVSKEGLLTILDSLYCRLEGDEAVVVHVYREFIMIGTRKKGHEERFSCKFTNYGFSPNHSDSKTESLSIAIRAIDEGNLPECVYRAINGDVEALRESTKYLIQAYTAKIERMKESDAPREKIVDFMIKLDAIKRRLTLPEAEFLRMSEPIIIEIPRNPKFFFEDDDDIVIPELKM